MELGTWNFFGKFTEGQISDIGSFDWSPEDIKQVKKNAIDAINYKSGLLTSSQQKRLKKKVWDMNPVVFALIANFVDCNSLFFDEDSGTILYQDLKLSIV